MYNLDTGAWKKLHTSSERSRSGASKVFARRAACGGMNICGAAFDYNTGLRLYSTHFMNQAMRAVQNLIKGLIWPVGQFLDMPDLDVDKD